MRASYIPVLSLFIHPHRILKKAGEEADDISKRGFFLRFLKSTQDAQILTELSERIKTAKNDFAVSKFDMVRFVGWVTVLVVLQLKSQLTVEQIVTGLASQVTQIQLTVEVSAEEGPFFRTMSHGHCSGSMFEFDKTVCYIVQSERYDHSPPCVFGYRR